MQDAPKMGTRQMGGTGPFGCFGTALSDRVLIVIGPADPDVPEPDSRILNHQQRLSALLRSCKRSEKFNAFQWV